MANAYPGYNGAPGHPQMNKFPPSFTPRAHPPHNPTQMQPRQQIFHQPPVYQVSANQIQQIQYHHNHAPPQQHMYFQGGARPQTTLQPGQGYHQGYAYPPVSMQQQPQAQQQQQQNIYAYNMPGMQSLYQAGAVRFPGGMMPQQGMQNLQGMPGSGGVSAPAHSQAGLPPAHMVPQHKPNTPFTPQVSMSSGPPPSSTPPQPQSLPHQAAPQHLPPQQQHQQQLSQQPPVPAAAIAASQVQQQQPPVPVLAPAAAAAQKPRSRRGIQIINPDTGKSIFEDSKGAGGSTTETAASSSTTPTTEGSAPVLPAGEAETKRAVSGVAAQFAAQVAAVADSTKSKAVDTPATPVEEEAKDAALEEKSQMLSVNTETTKREDSLYEPVSPTPLPDSPVEESKTVAAADEPPQPAAEETPAAADDGFVEAKSRKKKSAATKKAELNRRGQEKEKKGDLLEVFKETSPQNEEVSKPPVKEPTPAKEPTPVREPVKEPTPPTTAEPARPKEPEQVKAAKEHVFKQPTPPPIQVDEIVRPKPKPSPSPAPEAVPSRQAAAAAPETPENNRSRQSETPETAKSNGIDHAAANGSTDKDELEEGEITSDGEGESEEGSKTKLKYQYKEDQWSPMNLTGKKQYDREFLIKLQYDALSLTKPENLPHMEIVKDKPVSRQVGRAGGFDFAPHFVKPTISRPGRPGGPRTGSKSKESSGPKTRVINIPSFSQDVKLHKAENAFKAGSRKAKADSSETTEETELEDLRKKVRSILNKLTPQKFEKLVASFKELPINSGPKLEMSMALIFEKAVDEPSFSVAYAQMCQTLNKIEVASVEGQNVVKFRTLLISRVQQEFERDYMQDVDKEGYEAKMRDPNLSAEEKKKEKDLFEDLEMKARRRSLGNIRFIGELYNLNMLTVKIMHGCVRRLLKTTDDESLECLCRLITTVGQDFERQTNEAFKTQPKDKQQGLTDISVYFNEMKKIIASKTTSARVRFLMQDVIDLKNNQWKKRREDTGPKTIQQIHADAKKEQLNQSLMNSAPLPSSSGRDRRDDRRRDDGRKESRKGPSHSQQVTSDDGWTVPTRAARNTLDKVDTNKLRSMGRNTVDANTIQLGPRSGGFSSWGHGSSGAGRSSRQEEPAAMSTGNRFAAFSSAEPPAAYEGRSSGGGGYSRRPGAYSGRDSDSRAQLLQDVKSGVHTGGSGRSASTILTRTDSGGGTPAARSASMMVPPKTAVSALKGSSKLDRDEVEKISSSLLKEFLNVCDYSEAYQCVIDKFHVDTIHLFIENSINSVIEEKPLMRSRAGSLLSNLVKKELCSPEAYLLGLGAFLEFSPDLIVDIPKLWEFLASIIAPAFVEEALSMKHLLSSTQKLAETDPSLTGPYLAAVLKEMFKLNQEKSMQLWKASGLNLGQFLDSSQDLEAFIRSNKLEFLSNESAEKSGAFNFDSLRTELEGIVKNDNSRLIEVVKLRVPADQLADPQLMRVVMPLCVESCLEGLGGPISQIKLKEEEFKSLCERSLGSLVKGPQAELEALFSLQALMHRLEHPRGILNLLFMSLFDLDVVSTDSFTAWKEDTSPARQEGKGVAAKSCVSFFTYMTETINDDDEDDNEED